MSKVCSVEQFAASVAVTVNADVPDTVGVPESVPALSRFSPAGNVPPVTAKLSGANRLAAVIVCLISHSDAFPWPAPKARP